MNNNYQTPTKSKRIHAHGVRQNIFEITKFTTQRGVTSHQQNQNHKSKKATNNKQPRQPIVYFIYIHIRIDIQCCLVTKPEDSMTP